MPNERVKQIPADGTRSTGVPCWRNVEEFHRELPALSYFSRSYPRLEQQLVRSIAPSSSGFVQIRLRSPARVPWRPRGVYKDFAEVLNSGSFLARFPHVDGTRSPDRSILHSRGPCRCRTDIVCFRTLGW